MAPTSVRLKTSSRYLKTKILVDSETGFLHFHIWEPIAVPEDDGDRILRLPEPLLGRWDSWAYNYLTDPELWWIIPHQNKIEDPFAMPDFSDAEDLLEYPKYYLLDWVDRIQYPTITVSGRTEFFTYESNPPNRFLGELDHPPIPGTITIQDLRLTGTVELFTDNSLGDLSGDQGGSGSVSYSENHFKVEYKTPPPEKTLLKIVYSYAKLPKGTHMPQFEVSERLRIPSREYVRGIMLDAQS